MTKSDAYELFNTRRDGLAKVLNVVPTAISRLPEKLPEKKRREIIGAALDHGMCVKKIARFIRINECKNEGGSHNV